jgi:FkbM family methyltransferase
LLENRLVVHHVGGRAGSRSFPVLPAFERDIINVMYDADESCLSQIVESWKTQPSKTVVLPHCLSARDGVCKFHVNYDPYTSSLYLLNPRYAQFYYPYPVQNTRGFDYVLGDTFRTMKEVQVLATTLDTVVLDRKEVPGPDFLSIDTQGSELDILKGASRLLDTTILAVQAEIEMHPLYEGQPLFGDICQFLAQHNFDLVDIELYPKLLPMRGKRGFRGEGYVAHGEALFLKRPEMLANSDRGGQLNKLAFLATVFNQFECAQQCFEAKGFEPTPLRDGDADQQPQYLNFVSRLARAVASLPQRSTPFFSDLHSFSNSQARFQTQTPRRSRLRKYLRTIDFLVSALGFLRSLRPILRKLREQAVVNACWFFRRPGSAVEALFLEYRMKEQFLLAMKNRIVDSR